MKLILAIMFLLPSLSWANTHDGLVGWWKLDETSGNALDSSGQGNTGTPTGTTIVSNCKKSGCRSFNGTSDIIAMGNTNYLSANSPATISWWMNLSAVIDGNFRTPIILRKDDGAGWLTGIQSGGYGDIGWGPSGTCAARIASLPSPQTGTWFHIVLVYDGSGNLATQGAYTAYLNGSATATSSCPAWGVAAQINKFGNGGYQYFAGNLDDIRIYNRALTARDALDLYNVGSKVRNLRIRNLKINQ